MPVQICVVRGKKSMQHAVRRLVIDA